MPLSRAEIQKRYREKKKLQEGKKFLEKERKRQQQYYVPVASLSRTERLKRNEKIKSRVRKHRALRKAENEVDQGLNNQLSDSGYSTQEPTQNMLLRVKMPARRGGPRKRLSKALRSANCKLRKVISENIAAKRKVKTLQRKLQRLTNSKSKTNLTPKTKTAMFMAKTGLKGDHVKRQLMLGNVLLHHMKTSSTKDKQHRNGLYTAVAGHVIKKYRCIANIAGELNVNRKKLSKVIKAGVNHNRIRRRRVLMKMEDSVIKFLEREDNCRLQPGKRDATVCTDGKIQTRVLTDYLGNLYQKYLAFPSNLLQNETKVHSFDRMFE